MAADALIVALLSIRRLVMRLVTDMMDSPLSIARAFIQ
jgi:uncharacterized membrane-anchored protein